MADKPFRFGPAFLAAAAADVVHVPAATPAGVGIAAQNLYAILRHIRIVNVTAGAVTFTFWLGATGASAAGTEVIGDELSVAAHEPYDWYGMMRLDNGANEFLVGIASAGNSLTVEGEGVLAVI
jgi:hypothetical protein